MWRPVPASASGGRCKLFSRGSAAADFGDQINLALGLELSQIGVLKDLAVDRRGYALVDLAAEAGEAAVELQNHSAEGVRLHLELGHAAGEPAGGLARDDDARQGASRRSGRSPRAAAAATSAGHACAPRSRH